MIVVEIFRKEDKGIVLEEVSYKQAVMIGIAQSFAMVPGTSRSAATIIGGLLSGLNRRASVEFSFILAVPTMIIATAYDLYKNAVNPKRDKTVFCKCVYFCAACNSILPGLCYKIQFYPFWGLPCFYRPGILLFYPLGRT